MGMYDELRWEAALPLSGFEHTTFQTKDTGKPFRVIKDFLGNPIKEDDFFGPLIFSGCQLDKIIVDPSGRFLRYRHSDDAYNDPGNERSGWHHSWEEREKFTFEPFTGWVIFYGTPDNEAKLHDFEAEFREGLLRSVKHLGPLISDFFAGAKEYFAGLDKKQ